MTATREANYHFKQVLAGAPPDIAAAFGEALLALDAQRRNASAEAPGLLRKAWLALAKELIRRPSAELTPQQVLFLLSGAIGDQVVVKSREGERLVVSLLASETYESLLDGISSTALAETSPYLLSPLRRISALALHQLEPLDMAKPGRYREPDAKAANAPAPDTMAENLHAARDRIKQLNTELQQQTRRLTESLRAERLGAALRDLAELGQLASTVVQLSQDPAQLARLPLPLDENRHPAVTALLGLHRDLDDILSRLSGLPRELLRNIQTLHADCNAITNSASRTLAEPTRLPEMPVRSASEVGPRLVKDWDETNSAMVQIMLNSPNRNAWSSSRVLLQEQLEKGANPAAESCATPANLAAAIAKAEKLHPNCFPHDAAGQPLLPPVIIEPGVGVVRWLDDRFLISFVCTEIARPGKELALSPVDLTVLQIYGQFLARGDLFNYRGERIFTNFMGEYAGEVESKAAVKFTGAEKKLTLVSASTERDSSSREDAVRDYIDFLFCVSNGLPLPKRISPRKISVFLKYCIIGNLERTASLVLRFVVGADFQLARELLNKLADRQPRKLITLVDTALRDDVQLAARYRRDTRRALEEVMGRDWLADAVNAGQFEPQPPLSAQTQTQRIVDTAKPDLPPATPHSHDYFDV